MPTPVFSHIENSPFDPDDLNMPESPDHSTAVDVIAFAARTLLGNTHDVYRDMNWYPPDGKGAVAPDVMTLPKGTLRNTATVPKPKSYKQTDSAFPFPGVAVEVASESDSWPSMQAKLQRYRSLGIMSYVVTTAPASRIERFPPDRTDSDDWAAQPIPELGGLAVSFAEDGELSVTLPNGCSGRSNHQLAESIVKAEQAQTDHARAQADQAQAQADQLAARAEQLEAQLRALGAEPPDG